MQPKIEVISTCPRDSQQIEENGGDRIQLVSALEVGGLTPSSTIIRRSIQRVDIPTAILIRHTLPFLIGGEQLSLLEEEFLFLRDNFDVKALVIGGLQHREQLIQKLMEKELNEKQIHFSQTNYKQTQCKFIQHETNSPYIKKQYPNTKLMDFIQRQQSNKIQIVFHKAIDQCCDIPSAMEEVLKKGATRILTQGGITPATENLPLLTQITNERKVTLGGGITHLNVKQFLHLPLQAIHVGTCVRRNRYGQIDVQSLKHFVSLIKQ